ncbi:dynein axonemal assembly factor 4-like [Anticarsia gemmatalis]|uniref:dynein axonemal assembly factor 4-like n=1 Tax=Anticarsia gemmatalis TaxID=129554 RepID=UPI003F7754B7
MPILVKDYTWSQSSNVVHVRIPLNPVNHEKVDLFPTDKYIKAHFSPFLFEVFLSHDVDIKNSKCLVKEDMILLDLLKREEIEWNSLEKELSKEEKMKVRQEVIEKCQEEAKQESEDKRIKKSQLERFTVQQAMDIDNKQHVLMDSRRDNARKEAMDALEEWRVNADEVKDKLAIVSRPTQNGVQITELPPSDDEEDDKNKNNLTEKKEKVDIQIEKTAAPAVTPKKANRPQTPRKPVKTPVKSEFVENKKQQVEKRVLPRLRQRMDLEITHTPRTFPTPSRESQEREEQAWLKNITLARRATGFVSEDLRPEEQDPEWCKAKGDEFFRSGNFLGAVSAYSHGITLSDKLPSLFANRSATHFALGNFNKCVQDCSTALDLMRPPCESNRRSRAKCIARRAAALARLGHLNKAIDEMKAAAKLLPDDENIKKDIYDMERAWEQNPDSD